MAGKSHNHTMNIGIKVESSGVGKTNSELLQLTQEAKGLDGKKISLQVDLGDKASKSIDSIVSGIGNMEKAMNSISSKGIDGIQDAVSGATKSIDTLSSSIGSLQSSLDSISAKGIQDISSEMGSVSKSSADATSGVGSLSTAVQTINIGNIEELASALGQVQTQANDAASAVSKAMQTSGFTDNWNNSYGGRYGGMRYTGQGKGIRDLVSFLGEGSDSYGLTIENAMNKTRNMGVAKSWHDEDGITGMDAYWALDSATNRSLMSLNTLAAGVNAYAATTGATSKDIKNHAKDLADFGTMVMGLGYTEDVAQTAVMKLGRGQHGTFAALDQYGITKESLTSTGKWNGDENDIDGYLAAVSQFSSAMSDNLMKTPSGQLATLKKSASLGGYALGAMEAEWLKDIVGGYKKADDGLRTWTKSMGWGADVVDNFGQRVLSRVKRDENGNPDFIDYNNNGQYDSDTDELVEESVYVRADGKIVDDKGDLVQGMESEQDAINQGFSQKKTGVGLSTLIIGADQVISTYKTIKDTILGTYAEWRDLKRMKQIGLRNLFKEDSGYDYYNGYFHKVGQGMDETCKKMGDGCPDADKKGSGKKDAGKSKQKKKKGRLGRWKDKLLGRVDDSENQINKDFSQLNKQRPQVTKKDFTPLLKKQERARKKASRPRKGDYDLNKISTPFQMFDKKANKITKKQHKGIGRDFIGDTVPRMTGTGRHVPDTNLDFYKKKDRAGKIKGVGDIPNKNLGGYSSNQYKQIRKISPKNQRVRPSLDIPGLNTGRISEKDVKKPSLNKGRYKRRSEILNDSNLQNQYGRKLKNIGFIKKSNKDFIGNAMNNKGIGNFFSNDFQRNATDAYKRNQYTNKYGGYQKRALGAIYDTRRLKSKAKDYIGNKKDLLDAEYGNLKKETKKYARNIQKMPKQAFEGLSSNMQKQMKNMGTKLSNSFLGSQYDSLKRQGDAARNMITGSPMFKKAKSGAKGIKNSIWGQIKGNASALGNMTGFTPWFNNVTGRNKGGDSDDDDDGDGSKKKSKSKKKGFGSKLSSGVGKVKNALGQMAGKIGNVVSSLGQYGMALGIAIGAISLFVGLLEAIGIDLTTPFTKAISGAMKAAQPLIDSINEWLVSFGEKLEPYITQYVQELIPVLQQIGDALGPMLMDLIPIFGQGLVDFAKAIVPICQQIGEAWNDLSQNQDFVTGLKDALGFLWQILPYISPIFGMIKLISDTASGMNSDLAPIASTIWQILSVMTPFVDIWNVASWAVQQFNSDLTPIASIIWDILSATSPLVGIWNDLTGAAQQFSDTLGPIVDMIMKVLGAVSLFGTVGGLLGTVSAAPTTPTGQPQAGGNQTTPTGQPTLGTAGQPTLQSQAVQQMNADLDAINAKIANVNQQITTMMTTFNTSFQSLTTTLMTLTTMVITSILTIMTTIITLATTGFMMLGMVVTSTLGTILAALFAFSGQAISIMTLTATGMVTGFTGSFHGIAEAVSNEMSGAYDALCMWGDRMVEKARQIGADIRNALTGLGMGINSPGYIWNDIKGEFVGVYGEITGQGKRIVSAAKMVGTNIVRGYNNGYGSTPLAILDRLTTSSSKVPIETEIPTQNLPLQNLVSPPLPTQDALVSPPTVKPPRLVKDMAAVQDMPQQQTFNFNHYGDIDNEERSNKVLRAIASKMGFENKRAGRTVNKPRPAGG